MFRFISFLRDHNIYLTICRNANKIVAPRASSHVKLNKNSWQRKIGPQHVAYQADYFFCLFYSYVSIENPGKRYTVIYLSVQSIETGKK